MKRTAIAAVVLALLGLGQAAAHSITVTKPAAGETWLKGTSHTITWTKQGLLGPTVKVQLCDAADSTKVQTIADGVPNTGSFPWPVPASIVAGTYKVRVQSWSVTGTSGAFTIVAQGQAGGFHAQPGQVSAVAPGLKPQMGLVKGPPVRILSPVPNETWNPGQTYLIKWTADTVPDDAFDVDLCDSSGKKLNNLYSGVGQQNPDGSRQIMQALYCNAAEGPYRIRVTSWYAVQGQNPQQGTPSVLVNVVIKTKKIIENIPVQFQKAILECTDPGGVSCQQSIYLPNPGRAGEGYEFFQNSQHYLFCIFRTRLIPNLSVFQGKNGDVESATLIMGDGDLKNDGQHLGFCSGSLVALSAADVNTWNRYKVPHNAILYPLSGWSAPFSGTVDITVPVRAWLKKTAPNLGFVATGADQVGGAGGCSAAFTPIMYVTFIEKPDPCTK